MAGRQKHQIRLIVTAAIAVIVISIILLMTGPDGETENPLDGGTEARPIQSADAPPAQKESTDLSHCAVEVSETGDPMTDAANTSDRTPILAAVVPFGGRVTDAKTGDPITSFRILLEKRGQKRTENVIDEKVEDDGGRFAFTLEPWDNYRLTVHSVDHSPCERRRFDVPPERGLENIKITLDPGMRIKGRVVDDETGKPVPGAVAGVMRFTSFYHILPSGFPEGSNIATTDADGRFEVGGVKLEPNYGMPDHVLAGAAHPDYAVATTWIKPESGEPVEFRLEKGFRVHGEIRDDAGRPAAGICVYLGEYMQALRRPAYSDEKGRYRTCPARPGTVTLNASDLDYRYPEPVRFTKEEKEAEIVDGDVRVDFGPLPGQVIWHGTLFGLDGEPLPDTRITLTRAKAPNRGPGAQTLGQTRTDDEGRFEFRKLSPGEFTAAVYVSSERRALKGGDFEFLEPGRVARDIRLTCTGGTVSGVVIDETTGLPLAGAQLAVTGTSVSAWPYDEELERQSAEVSSADGTFCFSSMPAGSYRLAYSFADPVYRIKVTDGSQIDGIKIIVHATGELHLRLTGFCAEERKSINVDAHAASGRKHDITWPGRDPGETQTRRLETGDYLLRFDIDDLGEGQERFTIARGSITDLSIARDDLLPRVTDLEVRYYAGAWVPGYKRYLSDEFDIDEGAIVDLGHLRLTPSGYLDLEVFDDAGGPVHRPFVYCDGKQLGNIVEDNRELSRNRRLFFGLPTGKVLIRVEPNGCIPVEKKVILPPGQRTYLRVVVKRRG